jgi:hypothetical protein
VRRRALVKLCHRNTFDNLEICGSIQMGLEPIRTAARIDARKSESAGGYLARWKLLLGTTITKTVEISAGAGR